MVWLLFQLLENHDDSKFLELSQIEQMCGECFCKFNPKATSTEHERLRRLARKQKILMCRIFRQRAVMIMLVVSCS